jgi:hypothetical protein
MSLEADGKNIIHLNIIMKQTPVISEFMSIKRKQCQSTAFDQDLQGLNLSHTRKSHGFKAKRAIPLRQVY